MNIRPLNDLEARALRCSNALHGDMRKDWRDYVTWRFGFGVLAVGLVLLLCAAIPGAFQ